MGRCLGCAALEGTMHKPTCLLGGVKWTFGAHPTLEFKWYQFAIRADAGYRSVWVPCVDGCMVGIEAERGYYDAWKGSD